MGPFHDPNPEGHRLCLPRVTGSAEVPRGVDGLPLPGHTNATHPSSSAGVDEEFEPRGP